MIDLDAISQQSFLSFWVTLLLTQFVIEAVKYFVNSFRKNPIDDMMIMLRDIERDQKLIIKALEK